MSVSFLGTCAIAGCGAAAAVACVVGFAAAVGWPAAGVACAAGATVGWPAAVGAAPAAGCDGPFVGVSIAWLLPHAARMVVAATLLPALLRNCRLLSRFAMFVRLLYYPGERGWGQ